MERLRFARFCQSAIESAEKDQELRLQAVEISKKQQLEMFTAVFQSIQKAMSKSLGQLIQLGLNTIL